MMTHETQVRRIVFITMGSIFHFAIQGKEKKIFRMQGYNFGVGFIMVAVSDRMVNIGQSMVSIKDLSMF